MAKICINPGHHCELDSGAVNPDTGLREVDINIAIGLKLQRILADQGHETVYVHSNELYDITDIANDSCADLFVSLHCNSAENCTAKGTETFYHENSSRGSMLAQYIHCELVGIGLVNRGTKTANFAVLRDTDMPAALVEVGFISNDAEAALLDDEGFQQHAAEVIARGINNYLGAV